MSYDDFMKNMHMLDIVHLGPQTFSRLGLPEVQKYDLSNFIKTMVSCTLMFNAFKQNFRTQ